MLPGDIVWEFIKKKAGKLTYEEGYAIDKGAESFNAKIVNFICIMVFAC